MRKKILSALLMWILFISLFQFVPSAAAWGSTICGPNDNFDFIIKATRDGHWINLNFILDTHGKQIMKNYTRWVRIDKIHNVHYYEQIVVMTPPWYRRLITDTKKPIVLETRKLWLPLYHYKMNVTLYACGVHHYSVILDKEQVSVKEK